MSGGADKIRPLALGKDNIDEIVIAKLRKLLSAEEKEALLIREARQTTAWFYAVIRKLCKVKKEHNK